MKGHIYLTVLCLAVCVFTGCKSSREVVYLQDLPADVNRPMDSHVQIKVRPGDKVAIKVDADAPELAVPFNLNNYSRNLSRIISDNTSADYVTGGGNDNISVYTIDPDGFIAMPLLGSLYVAGKSRSQIADFVKWNIVNGGYIENPIITVELMNLHYSVLGEVERPGQYPIHNDNVTLLEALAQAGDLTIYGCRDAVSVVREIDGHRTRYIVDLRDASMFDSPAYYIQQGDMIYVEPNDVRAGQSTVNDNSWRSTGLWISLASLALSVTIVLLR